MGFDIGEVIEDDLTSYRVLTNSRAFTERHLDRAFWGQAEIKLGAGASAAAVAAALARQGLPIDEDVAKERDLVQIALRPLVVALLGVSGVTVPKWQGTRLLTRVSRCSSGLP